MNVNIRLFARMPCRLSLNFIMLLFFILSLLVDFIDSWDTLVARETFSVTTTSSLRYENSRDSSSAYIAFDIFTITVMTVSIVFNLLIVIPIIFCCYKYREHRPWILCFNLMTLRELITRGHTDEGNQQSAMNANTDRILDCQASGSDEGLELHEVVIHPTSSRSYVVMNV